MGSCVVVFLCKFVIFGKCLPAQHPRHNRNATLHNLDVQVSISHVRIVTLA